MAQTLATTDLPGPGMDTAATHRCPANSDDGVATVLESLAR